MMRVGQDPQSACGFAYGREMSNDGHLIRVTGARATTCERASPHYALEARRLVYDTQSGDVQVRGGALRMYGVRIPLLPTFTTSLTDETKMRPDAVPEPRWGGRDGFALKWGLPFQFPGEHISAKGSVLLTSRRGIRGQIDVQGPIGPMTGHVRASHKEDVKSDVDQWSLIDRRLEFVLDQAWDTDLFGGTQLAAELSAGDFKQYAVAGQPEVSDQRALASLRLSQNDDQWRRGMGSWWWTEARTQLYDAADEYTVIELGAGAGTRLTDWLSGSLTYIHRDASGATPFEFDDEDIESEISGRARIDFDDNWSMRWTGRYDVEIDDMRDYEIELARRVHCLTWKLAYRDVSESISLGVAINGLFGDEPAAQERCVEDGPPRYWRAQDRHTEQDQATE